MKTTMLILFLSASSISAQEGLETQAGGSACVVAKKLGNSLAIEWVLGSQSVAQAVSEAQQALEAKGFEHTFPQGSSTVSNGWFAMIKTKYQTTIGRTRISYGCGFSSISPQAAEANAIVDLQTYSWGWKTSYGYERVQLQQF